MELLIIFIGIIVFDIAAIRWGINSCDSINSPEWERRRAWAVRMVGTTTSYVSRPAPLPRIPAAPRNVMLNTF